MSDNIAQPNPDPTRWPSDAYADAEAQAAACREREFEAVQRTLPAAQVWQRKREGGAS